MGSCCYFEHRARALAVQCKEMQTVRCKNLQNFYKEPMIFMAKTGLGRAGSPVYNAGEYRIKIMDQVEENRDAPSDIQ